MSTETLRPWSCYTGMIRWECCVYNPFILHTCFFHTSFIPISYPFPYCFNMICHFTLHPLAYFQSQICTFSIHRFYATFLFPPYTSHASCTYTNAACTPFCSFPLSLYCPLIVHSLVFHTALSRCDIVCVSKHGRREHRTFVAEQCWQTKSIWRSCGNCKNAHTNVLLITY